MAKKKRRGGVQTAAAKKKAGDKLRAHKKIRSSKPEKCQICERWEPIDHLLIEGERVWMCRLCFCQDSPEYLAEEKERQKCGYLYPPGQNGPV